MTGSTGSAGFMKGGMVFLRWKGGNGGMATACTVSALAYSAVWDNHPALKQRFTKLKTVSSRA